jgi:hypothetical protein
MSATTIEAATKIVEQYGKLEDDFDLEQAAPSEADVALALKFLKALPENFSAPMPMLSCSGKLGFYWNTRPFYMDVDIEKDARFSIYISSTHRDLADKWYPKASLEEFVSIYVANVGYWTMEVNGASGLMK